MIQHAVIKISLKMELPNLALASITMSRWGRFTSQLMGIEFQHALLKEHSKKR
jgi:hypothetical protein